MLPSECKNRYNSYITHIDSIIPSNSTVFWSYIWRNSVTSSINKNGNCEADAPKGYGQSFPQHFLSVYNQPLNDIQTFEKRLNSIKMSVIQTSPEEVKKKWMD